MSVYVPTEWAAKRLGKHPSTIHRWRQRGLPAWLETLASLELERELGALHPDWHGWHLSTDGRLYSPTGEPFTPGQVACIDLYRARAHELELAANRARFRSRLAKRVRSLRRAVTAGAAAAREALKT